MERRLKNYLKYQEKIEAYATASGIEIVYCKEDGVGSFSHHRSRIRIDEDLSECEEIAVLLHELGHSLDDTIIKKPMEKRLSAAYTAIYSNKATKPQIELVVACEIRAWEYGRSIAKRLRICLGKWYDVVMANSLASYRR